MTIFEDRYADRINNAITKNLGGPIICRHCGEPIEIIGWTRDYDYSDRKAVEYVRITYRHTKSESTMCCDGTCGAFPKQLGDKSFMKFRDYIMGLEKGLQKM